MHPKITFLVCFFHCVMSFAQKNSVEVIGSGKGKSEKQAINEALRDCIERTMGVFISSSTTIKNDVLINDQISSVASGEVKDYTVINSSKKNGSYEVLVSATITPEKLVLDLNKSGANKFEVKGGVYSQNIDKEKFYAAQEYQIMKDFLMQFENVNFSNVNISMVESPIKIDSWRRAIKAHNGFCYEKQKNKKIRFKLTTAECLDKFKTLLNSTLVNNLKNGKCFYVNHFKDNFHCPTPTPESINRYNDLENLDDLNYEISVCLYLSRNKNLDQFERSLSNLYSAIKIKNYESYSRLMGSPAFFDDPNLKHLNYQRGIIDVVASAADLKDKWYFRSSKTHELISEFYDTHVNPCFDIRTALKGNFEKYTYIASQSVRAKKGEVQNEGYKKPGYEPAKNCVSEIIYCYSTENAFKKVINFPVVISLLISQEELSKMSELKFESTDQRKGQQTKN